MKKWLAATMLMTLGAGCATHSDPTLSPEAFVDRRPAIGRGSNEPIDHPGALTYDSQHPPEHMAADGQTISPLVREHVRNADRIEIPSPTTSSANSEVAAPTQPAIAASEPTTGPTGVSTATFQYVGAVVAEVNGKPVFADKVLARLERALATEARHRDQATFRMLAEELVHREIAYQLSDEVHFAAAEKALDKNDKELAKSLTMDWRRKQVTAAGGAEAEARARFAAQGQNFEEAATDEYRHLMWEIYLQRKIMPLIQISAEDIRRYYQDHIRDFSVSAAAKFRVIKIDLQKDESAAMAKAREVLQRANAGDDFVELASRFNDDPILQGNKGAVGENGWMEKDAYVNEKVEQAVWQLKPGQVTPLIQVGNYVYIAKLEAIRDGKARTFEDPQVQDAIEQKLRGDQLTKLTKKQTEDLEKNSVIWTNQGMDQVAVDMVMQRYPLWAAGK